MPIRKPEKKRIEGIKLGGKILEVEDDKWFIVGSRIKSRELKKVLKELTPRTQKIENNKKNYFKKTIKNAYVNLIYLNWESAKGLYKEPENNLPYEVLTQFGELIYRQSTIDRKEDIFNRLEKIAVEEGLRK